MNWPMVKLGDVCTINPRLPKNANPEQEVTFLAMAAVSEKGEISSQETRILHATKKGFTYFERGDVLMAKITPCFENGKATLTNNLNTQIGFGSTEFHVLRAIPDLILPEFIFYLIWNERFRIAAAKEMTGSAGQKRVSADYLKEYKFYLPSIFEQEKIVSALNKGYSIHRKRQQTIKLADDFLRATFHKKFSNQTFLLNGWELKELKDIASIQTGPFGTQLHKEDYVENGIPLINPINIKNGIIIPNFKLCVDRQKYERLKEYHLKKGDIIMGRRGEMGRCALINDKEDGWFCGTGSLFIRLNTPNEIVSFYLNEYLSSESIKNFLIKESRGVTMANLNKDIVGKIKVIIPPENALTSFMKIKLKVEGIKEKITHSDLESLLSSLSKKYVQSQNPL